MPQHPVLGYRRRMDAGCGNELAITQSVHGQLDRTLGEARLFRDHAQTHRDRPPALSYGATKEEQVNQEG